MSLPTSDQAALESTIRQLWDKVAHQQRCIIGLFETIHRFNENFERLAEEHPELHLVRLTTAPNRQARMDEHLHDALEIQVDDYEDD